MLLYNVYLFDNQLATRDLFELRWFTPNVLLIDKVLLIDQTPFKLSLQIGAMGPC